jgi:hypothetical protein
MSIKQIARLVSPNVHITVLELIDLYLNYALQNFDALQSISARINLLSLAIPVIFRVGNNGHEWVNDDIYKYQ